MIGDSGIKISKSHKVRISLARAIYQDADIYLLDDPLSAVDPAVANGIFEKGIKGYLADKCVVLVTHQLQFLRQSERIIVLDDGKQAMTGNFDEVTEQGFDINEILQQYSKTAEMHSKHKEKEADKDKNQLLLVKGLTDQPTEEQIVLANLAQTVGDVKSDADKKRKLERAKSIEILQKQVDAMAKEKEVL